MKKIVLALILFTFAYSVKGQTLTIPETINYINQTLHNNRFDNNSYFNLTLLSDGTLKIYDTLRKWTDIMNISEVTVTDVDDNSFDIICFDKEPQIVYFGGQKSELSRGVNKCIRTVDEGNYEPKSPYFRTGFSLKDPYDTKKLCNAFKYLFALVQENGTYKRNDDDPFAPSNFNPNRFEIKGNMQSSSIELEVDGGVYHIFVTIGNIEKKFVLDSGASDVTISTNLENELINSGAIKKEYYGSPALYKLADGNIILCRRLILPELKIGKYTVTNVRTVIGKDSSPLLLGKSFLDKFKKWSIDNTTKVLNLEI